MYKRFFLLTILISTFSGAMHAANIKGQINLNDDWSPILYISVIQSFDDLHTASYDFLRYQVEIDSAGYFEFEDLELEAEDRLYRLHICKKGDPISTIIIGGQEENFIHLILNKQSDVRLENKGRTLSLAKNRILGSPETMSLSNLFDLQKKLNTPPDLPSAQNRSFIKKQVLNDLQMTADTASNPIVRLLAFHLIQERFGSLDHLALMEKVHHDLFLAKHSSPYFESFSKQLNYLQFQAEKTTTSNFYWLKWLGIILLIPLIGFAIWRIIKSPVPKKEDQKANKIQSLSTQEKRVFNLLQKGKTNKEISSALHIEVSTVKSHTNKIYSRLGVKSRKEIMNKDV